MENSNALKSNLIKYALILGFIGIIISLLVYTLNEDLMIKWWFGVSMIVISIIVYVLAAKSYRNDLGGYASFRQVFIFVFLVVVLSTFITSAFSLIQFNLIDPDMGDRLQKKVIENTISMMEKFNVPEETLDEQIEKMESNKMFSNTSIIKQFFINSLVGGIVLGLILGAIFKRKKPEEFAV